MSDKEFESRVNALAADASTSENTSNSISASKEDEPNVALLSSSSNDAPDSTSPSSESGHIQTSLAFYLIFHLLILFSLLSISFSLYSLLWLTGPSPSGSLHIGLSSYRLSSTIGSLPSPPSPYAGFRSAGRAVLGLAIPGVVLLGLAVLAVPTLRFLQRCLPSALFGDSSHFIFKQCLSCWFATVLFIASFIIYVVLIPNLDSAQLRFGPSFLMFILGTVESFIASVLSTVVYRREVKLNRHEVVGEY